MLIAIVVIVIGILRIIKIDLYISHAIKALIARYNTLRGDRRHDREHTILPLYLLPIEDSGLSPNNQIYSPV